MIVVATVLGILTQKDDVADDALLVVDIELGRLLDPRLDQEISLLRVHLPALLAGAIGLGGPGNDPSFYAIGSWAGRGPTELVRRDGMGYYAAGKGGQMAPEKVVYLLGAGFSAPLGLPVMRNFLEVSKDLYFSDRKKYSHFEKVFDTIRDMHVSLTHYDVDLLNVEEVLSILEMEDMLRGEDRSRAFAEYIKNVIEATTPDAPRPDLDPFKVGPEFHKQLFGPYRSVEAGYGGFVASLVNLVVTSPALTSRGNFPLRSITYRFGKRPKVQYSIVTVNYDLVVESVLRYIVAKLTPADGYTPPECPLEIAKLHGSVDGRIVAPTWRKWAVGGLKEQWQLAYHLLSTANHIRILGYSLPEADSYLRYLLVTGAMKSPHLKRIDVVDRDPAIRGHYKRFVRFKEFRFAEAEISEYLTRSGREHASLQRTPLTGEFSGYAFNRLESWHEAFMEEGAS